MSAPLLESMVSDDPPRNRKRQALTVILVVFAAWTAIGTMNTFQRLANTADMRAEYPVWALAKIAMGTHWLKAVLSLPLLYFVDKCPLGRESWKRRLPLYAIALALYVTIFLLVRPYAVPSIWYNAATGRVMVGQTPGFGEAFFVMLRSFFLDLIYGFFITVLAAHLWQYAKRMRSNQVMQERLQARLATAELQALKQQLQPHFLFNTLHTISNLAPIDSTKAQRMIARLSELLRLSLEHVSSEAVPIRRELEFLESYIEIEKTRFEERLQVHIDFSEEILDAELPNMILQPLVENSIRHGISKKANGGSVTIRGRREDGRVVINIEDDGKVPAVSHASSGHGIGLNNTRARLEQRYEHDFDFSIRPTSAGTTVHIEVPFRLHSESSEVSA